jgi:hypothetical protein
MSQLFLWKKLFLTARPQLLRMQELPTAPTQGTLHSYSRLQLLPETEFPLAVADLPQGTQLSHPPLSYSRPQLLPEAELLSTVPVLPQGTPLSHSRFAAP